jgi:hypothetical protein
VGRGIITASRTACLRAEHEVASRGEKCARLFSVGSEIAKNKKKKKKGEYIQKLQQEITRISQGTPAPNSSSRPFRRLRARTHAAALAAIRIGARAAAALVTAGVPLGAPHMRTTQLVAHNGALQCNANRLRCIS